MHGPYGYTNPILTSVQYAWVSENKCLLFCLVMTNNMNSVPYSLQKIFEEQKF